MCSIKIAIDASENNEIRFAGKQLKKHDNFQPNDVWCEFPCNRKDDHPMIGKHWFEGNGIYVEFEVSEGEVWMA